MNRRSTDAGDTKRQRRTRITATACAIALAAIAATPARAYTFYTDASLFKPAAPGAILEDFGDGNPAVNNGFTSPPLDNTTNDGVFATGDIHPGLSISNIDTGNGGIDPGGTLKPFESSWFGMTLPAGQTNAISNTNDVYGLSMSFSSPLSALGFEIYYEGRGLPDRSVGVTFYDFAGNVIIPEVEITSEIYLGVVVEPGDAPIARVVLDNPFGLPSGRFEAIDNVSFAPVPEPTTALLLAAGVGILGFRRGRARVR